MAGGQTGGTRGGGRRWWDDPMGELAGKINSYGDVLSLKLSQEELDLQKDIADQTQKNWEEEQKQWEEEQEFAEEQAQKATGMEAGKLGLGLLGESGGAKSYSLGGVNLGNWDVSGLLGSGLLGFGASQFLDYDASDLGKFGIGAGIGMLGSLAGGGSLGWSTLGAGLLGGLGGLYSTIKVKKNIIVLEPEFDGLHPIFFEYVFRPGLEKGYIAEEVAKLYPEVCLFDKDNKPYAVNYDKLKRIRNNG